MYENENLQSEGRDVIVPSNSNFLSTLSSCFIYNNYGIFQWQIKIQAF